MYRLNGFCPPSTPQLGGYGYSISLDRDFSKLAASVKIPADMTFFHRTLERMLSVVDMADCPARYIQFYNDTCLATNFTVAGNACGLDIEWHELNDILKPESTYPRYLEYWSHNIDSMRQAYALLMIFSHWYEFAEAMIYDMLSKKSKGGTKNRLALNREGAFNGMNLDTMGMRAAMQIWDGA
jgi:hypothetical protein